MKLHRAMVTRYGLSNACVMLAAACFCALCWVSVVKVPTARWFGFGIVVFLLLSAVLYPGRASDASGSEVHPSSSADLGASDGLSDREHGQQQAVGEPKAGSGLPLVGTHKDNDESPAAPSHDFAHAEELVAWLRDQS